MLMSCRSASSPNSWKNFSISPLSDHSLNRLYTVCHGPYRSGRSRQAAPASGDPEDAVQHLPGFTPRTTLVAHLSLWQIGLQPFPFGVCQFVPSNNSLHVAHLMGYIRHRPPVFLLVFLHICIFLRFSLGFMLLETHSNPSPRQISICPLLHIAPMKRDFPREPGKSRFGLAGVIPPGSSCRWSLG